MVRMLVAGRATRRRALGRRPALERLEWRQVPSATSALLADLAAPVDASEGESETLSLEGMPWWVDGAREADGPEPQSSLDQDVLQLTAKVLSVDDNLATEIVSAAPPAPLATGSSAPAPLAPPEIGPIADIVGREDEPLGSIPFIVSDADTPVDRLSAWVTSSNPHLLPPDNILVERTGPYWSMTLATAADQFGLAKVTLFVSDGLAISQRTFQVTIEPVNDPPVTVGIPDVQVDPGQGKVVIDLFEAFEDAEDADQQLSFKVYSNSNPDLFESAVINRENGTLILTLNPAAQGSSTLTILATDTGGLSVSLDPLETTVPVFDKIGVEGLVTPDLGLKDMRLWTSWYFFKYDAAAGQYIFDELDEEQFRRQLHDPQHAISNGPIVFDIENDFYLNSPDGRTRWAHVLDIARQERPDLQFGIYRILPERNWFDPYNWQVAQDHLSLGIQTWYTKEAEQLEAKYRAWQYRNQVYRTMPVSIVEGGGSVAQRVDYVNASLYTLKRNYRPEEQALWLPARIDPVANTITVTGPSYVGVERVWLMAATDGKLPDGLVAGKPYHVVGRKGQTFQLAEYHGGPRLDLAENFSGRIYVGAIGPWDNPWLDPNVVYWYHYAEANIAEARKFGVPVYAWITPSIHAKGTEYLDKDFFRLQLDLLAPLVDGIVVYQEPGSDAAFHRKQGWWKALGEFMDANRIALPSFTVTVGRPSVPAFPPRAVAAPTYDIRHAALFYDGLDDFLDAGNVDDYKIRNRDYSLSLWFRIEPGSEGREMYLVSQGQAATHDGFDVRYRGDYMSQHGKTPRLEFRARDEQTGRLTSLSVPVPDLLPGTWNHLVITLQKGGEAKLYLNGQQRGAAPHAASGDIDGNYSFHIGRSTYDAPYDLPFHGHIDQVRVFHRALPAPEIARRFGLHNLNAPSSAGATRLVARFDTDDHDDGLLVGQTTPKPSYVGNVLTGAPSPADGSGGSSVLLNGEGYVEVGTADALKLRNRDFSLSAWFYIQPDRADQVMSLIAQGFPAERDGYELTYRGDYKFVHGKDPRLEFVARDQASGGFTYLSASLPELVPGRWFHVVVTVEQGGEAKLYFNGQLRQAQPHEASGDVEGELPLRIGRSNYGQPYDRYLHGRADRVEIFNGVLSAEQAKILYESGVPPQADLDLDGDVDIADLNRMLVQWTGSLQPGKGTRRYEDGDVDGDRDVDTADLQLLIACWTGPLASTAGSPLPPPPTESSTLAADTFQASSQTEGLQGAGNGEPEREQLRAVRGIPPEVLDTTTKTP